MASAPGSLYTFPWERLGSFKFVVFAPMVANAWYRTMIQGRPLTEVYTFHLLVLTAMRCLVFQLWGTVSRLPSMSRKHRIVAKGVKFEQIDHEAAWENMLILTPHLLWLGSVMFFRTERSPFWDWWSVPIFLAVHMGPVEWLYYWGHRALHHHYLYTRYHQHHHTSFISQPITSSNHPFLEHLFYHGLFWLPTQAAVILGHNCVGILYLYLLTVDFLNGWGHCNFEFIPTWVFTTFPFLKYLIYSPTYHSLHHTKVHTNFSLFMPIYDYLYGTVDSTTDSLYQEVRSGQERKVDCVYLTHATDILSTFHLHCGFQTFSAQPYSRKWYMWIMWPLGLPLVLLAWLVAKPFVVTSHFFGNHLELETWIIPRLRFQYFISSEMAKIGCWIEECIFDAQAAGAKVLALGLHNKIWQDELDEVSLAKKGASIAVVTGETLAAALVAKKVQAKHQHYISDFFITSAHSRVGQALSIYLCEHGFRIMALLPSEKHAERVRNRLSSKFQDNLVYVSNYDAGKSCKVWLVGENIGRDIQKLAPKGAFFYPFDVFPIKECRKDCFYSLVPCMKLPKDAQTIHSCEDILPRNVARASYCAAMVHAYEGSRHHDFGNDISTKLMDESYELAMKHGFSIV